jgi:signal transduction histidine kinase
MNLLSNASKFGAQKGNVIINVTCDDGELLIEVKDDGEGISTEEQEMLFEAYHRVRQDQQKYSGTGLGLAVAKQIVEAHGGRIWVASQPGHGSTFSFTIPLKSPVVKKTA